MFRRFIAILLIVSLIASGFQRYLAYAGFELNQKYIAENLCINKSRPWMHCNGKCYFMRKVKEAQQREASNERQAQKNLFQESFAEPLTKIVFYTHLIALIDTPYHESKSLAIYHPLFRPPRLA